MTNPAVGDPDSGDAFDGDAAGGDRAADSLLILANGSSWQERYQVTALVSSEIAAERPVHLALFFGALERWCKGQWGLLDPTPPLSVEQIENAAFPSLETLIVEVRKTGLLRVYACSTSVRLLGLDPATVQGRVDAILGWQSFSRMSRQVARTLSF